MNVCGVTFGGYLAKILSFKLGNLLYKSNFYLLSEGTVQVIQNLRQIIFRFNLRKIKFSEEEVPKGIFMGSVNLDPL